MRSETFQGAAATLCVVLVAYSTSTAAAAEPHLRADSNDDGRVNIADAQYTLNRLFLGGPAPPCAPKADANADDRFNIADAQYTLNALFLGGPAPPDLTAAEIAECTGIDPEAIARGRAVYEQPSPAERPFSCSRCHADVPDDQSEILHPASSLHDAVRRPQYKGGQLDNLVDAANTCRVHWMQTTPWTEDDPEFTDLVAFLESIAPDGPAPPVVYTIGEPAIGPPTGNGQAGCELFHRSCANCHGPGGGGTLLAPSLVQFELSPEFVRAKVRLSGPDDSVYEGLAGEGVMPFWSTERLSDEALEDIVTYLVERPMAECLGN